MDQLLSLFQCCQVLPEHLSDTLPSPHTPELPTFCILPYFYGNTHLRLLSRILLSLCGNLNSQLIPCTSNNLWSASIPMFSLDCPCPSLSGTSLLDVHASVLKLLQQPILLSAHLISLNSKCQIKKEKKIDCTQTWSKICKKEPLSTELKSWSLAALPCLPKISLCACLSWSELSSYQNPDFLGPTESNILHFTVVGTAWCRFILFSFWV